MKTSTLILVVLGAHFAMSGLANPPAKSPARRGNSSIESTNPPDRKAPSSQKNPSTSPTPPKTSNPVSTSVPKGYEYQIVSPTNHAGLTFRFLKPTDFKIADLPPTEFNPSESKSFLPLTVALTEYGPMVFSVGARPSYEDGSVEQWLAYLMREEGYEYKSISETQLGDLPAVTCDALQKADGVVMKMRMILLEDGGRMFQVTAMAPEPFFAAALEKFNPMLQSFQLRESRGTKVALRPGQKPPATKAPPELLSPTNAAPKTATAGTSSARLTPEELAQLALGTDTSSLDPEHPANVNFRNNGVGLVPRMVSVDLPTKSARVAAGAVAGIFRVPLGWHAIDDGKRTLVFDGGGRIQVNLSQRLHEGLGAREFARGCLDQYLDRQPGLEVTTLELDGISGAGVRAAKIDDETLDQYFLVRDLGRSRVYLVARVTANAEDAVRALNLAGDILATFEAPQSSTP